MARSIPLIKFTIAKARYQLLTTLLRSPIKEKMIKKLQYYGIWALFKGCKKFYAALKPILDKIPKSQRISIILKSLEHIWEISLTSNDIEKIIILLSILPEDERIEYILREDDNDERRRIFLYRARSHPALIQYCLSFLPEKIKIEYNFISAKPKVLRTSDPKTIYLIHRYLDQHKGKTPNGHSITKLRRYFRKATQLATSSTENVYILTQYYDAPIQIALDESVIIFNAENREKRRLYILKNLLAAGSFGKVKEVDFATFKLLTKQERVIKVVPFGELSKVSKESVIQRATMEQELGGSEGYVLRESSSGNKAYIDLPKHSGKELYYYLKNGMITDLAEKINIAIEILQQLKDRFHDKGYLHRDLKSDNIIYDPKTKKIRIIDMDFAVKANKVQSNSYKSSNKGLLYQDNKILGAVGYIAPEIQIWHSYSDSSDVYAAGVIFATLSLSANITWSVTTEGAISNIILVDPNIHKWAASEIKKENSSLSPLDSQKLQRLILAMTNKDPGKRIGVEEALKILYEIKNCLEDKTKKSANESISTVNTATQDGKITAKPTPSYTPLLAGQKAAATTITTAPTNTTISTPYGSIGKSYNW